MGKVLERVNEGDTVQATLRLSESTDGNTLSVRYRAEGGSGTGTQIATPSGAAADTDITFSLDWSGVAVGTYDLEVWEDFGGASERIVFPDAEVDQWQVQIVDRFGVS